MGWADARAIAQGADILICAACLPLGDKLCCNRFGQAIDLPEPQTQRDVLVQPAVVGSLRSRLALFFKRAIPCRQVHISRQHLDPVLCCIAHDLGGRIETHRL